MTSDPTRQTVRYRTYETSYKVFGDLHSSRRRPLVVVHGGPGIPHNYLTPLSALWTTHSIPVVFYDQIGCGGSTRLPDAPVEHWSIEFFLGELDNLLTHLNIETDYDLLGHSWGGMLSAEHSVLQPKGLKHLVLAHSPSSIPLWNEQVVARLAQLDPDSQAILARWEEPGVKDYPEYKAAAQWYNTTFVCRVDPLPEPLAVAFELATKDLTVHNAMHGSSDFGVTGKLKDWSSIDRLHNIIVPTLVLNGNDKYDASSDATVRPAVERIPNSQWVKFEESSHTSHFEEPEKFLRVVGDFLVDVQQVKA